MFPFLAFLQSSSESHNFYSKFLILRTQFLNLIAKMLT